ncbi:MAG: nucleoside hydrolase [Velocimicrobium sp.]
MKKRNIIMDCDPGIDDAIALIFAIANDDKLNILGISTVAGNLSSDVVTNNALALTEVLGRSDIPVARGARKPLLRTLSTAGDIHGKYGLGSYELPKPKRKEEKEHAVVFMRNLIMNASQMVTLVPTGPLTNIALLLHMYPEVKEKIELICLMGGASKGGNVTKTGEFNIWADPEAASIVYQSGLPIVMCGLDVTTKSGFCREQAAYLKNCEGFIGKMCGEMLEFYLDCPHYKDKMLASIHDASTIMYLLHPEIYKVVRMEVEVDCSEHLNRGMTVCDFNKIVEKDKEGINVLMDVDTKLFEFYLMEGIETINQRLL